MLINTTFVILHYCQPKVTEECVSSLLNLKGDKEIVIVDNASPDNSGILLKEKYKSDLHVHVILNNVNSGFAHGNNVGYRYAKEYLNSDVIIVLNNDTLIRDKEFIRKLQGNDITTGRYHILAPDILTVNGEHQNPHKLRAITKKEIKKNYVKKWISLLFYSLPLLYKLRPIKKRSKQNKFINKSIENIVPHGSAIIYLKKWIENEDFAFYPGTFMYCEEDLLYLYIQFKGYKTLYEPSFQILHLEDVSTNNAHRNIQKRMIFQNKKKIESYRVLLDFMNKHFF